MASPPIGFKYSPAARAALADPPPAPVRAQLREEFAAHLGVLKAVALDLFKFPELNDVCKCDLPEDPKSISEQAWALARAFEKAASVTKEFSAKEGAAIPKEALLYPFLSASELLARGVLGENEGHAPSGEVSSMLRAAVDACVKDSRQMRDSIKGPVFYDAQEIRRANIEARLKERRVEKDCRARVLKNADSFDGVEQIFDTLESAATLPSAEVLNTASFRQREMSMWRSRVVADHTPTAPAWVSLVTTAAIPLVGLATGIIIRYWPGASELGAFDTARSLLFIGAAGLLAVAGALKLYKATAKPASTIKSPEVVAPPNTPNIGKYVSNDKNFERRMGVLEVRVMIPPLGGSMLLQDWLQSLREQYPGRNDIPRHQDLFYQKTISAGKPNPTLAKGETLLTLPIEPENKALPLNPNYEVVAAILLDRNGCGIAGDPLAIEEGVLGSFTLTSAIPHTAKHIQFKVRERENLGFDSQVLERIKKYLPQQYQSGTAEITQERYAMQLLYTEDGQRAAHWIEHLRGHGYNSCQNPELNPLLERFGMFWNTAFHAHRSGNCDYLCAHATAELICVNTAAFSVTGLTPDGSTEEFVTSALHAQTAVLTESGTKFFDLTIGAKRSTSLDPSRLTPQERETLFCESIAKDPDEAFIRGILLRKALVRATRDDAPLTRGHSFRDDSQPQQSPVQVEATSYIAAILKFKRDIAMCERKGYAGLGDLLRSERARDLIYRKVDNDQEAKLQPEFQVSRWPRPSRLAFLAAKEALQLPTLPAAEKKKLVEFFVARSSAEFDHPIVTAPPPGDAFTHEGNIAWVGRGFHA